MYSITGTYEEQSAWWDIQSLFTNLLEGAEKHFFHGAGWIDAPNLKGVAFAALTQVLGDYDSIENMNLTRSETLGAWINTVGGEKYAVVFSN